MNAEEELIKFMEKYHNKEMLDSSKDLSLMFEIHNILFPNNKEFGKSCPACRGRVFKRLKNYYTSLKGKNNPTY
jgi:ferredoxin-thioredoxin reductase catalytic subunit